MKITIEEEQLQFAEMQRLEALKMAFDIINLFSAPSLDPEMYLKLDEIKSYLINHYKN